MSKIKSITCDVCKTTYTNEGTDAFEFQEFLKFRNVGGYGSVWGDGTKIKLDICQNCQLEMFKKYVRLKH